MKEYFVIADTHSFFIQMLDALINAGFDINNPEHIIIGCGDYLDRGNGSMKIVDFLYKLHKDNRTILIRGNHEDLFEEMVKREYPFDYDISNGTVKSLGGLQTPYEWNEGKTMLRFEEATHHYDKRWRELLDDMVDFYEGNHYIFVHGWIPMASRTRSDGKLRHFYDPNWRSASAEKWKEARWENGMFMASLGITEKDKTIVCGHWHCSWGNVRENPENKDKTASELSKLEFADEENFHTFKGNGVIGLDACTAFTGYCNCLRLTEEEI